MASTDKVPRDKTCPVMLRVFVKEGGHHHAGEFEAGRSPADDELQMYTWPDATLRELVNLIKEVNEPSRRPSLLSVALVYPDERGAVTVKEVGAVYSNKRGRDDDRTLRSLRFQSGDYLDVAIMPA